MNKPAFITFTGADDETSVNDMAALAFDYPVEFGILFSPKRQGSGRYPSMHWVKQLTMDLRGSIILSAHLCGGDARDVIQEGESRHDYMLREYFARAQINTVDPKVNMARVAFWGGVTNLDPIMQCRGMFDPSWHHLWPGGVSALFDASGGRGISPKSWPQGLPGVRVGYAGGLNPDNVAAAVAVIGTLADDYWIDMETGVRDENDRFSIAKCRAVCEAVYGKP